MKRRGWVMRIAKQIFILGALIVATQLRVGAVEATPIDTFQVTGSFATPVGTSLTGNFTVDEGVPIVTTADLVVGGISGDFNDPISTNPVNGSPSEFLITIDNSFGDALSFDVNNLFSPSGGLITGGEVFPGCPAATPLCIIFNFSALAENGTGTFASGTPIPEPRSE